MAYAAHIDFHRPSSQLSLERKPSSYFDDSDALDDSILDGSIMSPSLTHRRDSFANSNAPLFSPETSVWEDFSTSIPDRNPGVSTNPFFEQNNNPFMRLEASQAATYGQHPTGSWPLFEPDSRSDTPVASKSFESFQPDFDAAHPSSFMPGANGGVAFGGLPADNVRPTSVFPPASSSATPLPPSPHSNKEWMAMAAHEMESRPLPKRMRPNTPPPRACTPGLRRGDGIRKKNARFEIPAERSLSNIDMLIQQSTNEDEKKELKQQKRLLRNRQAALDSRQRKKKHTEELEEEKKGWSTRMTDLSDEIDKLRMELNMATQEKEQWRRQHFDVAQVVDQLNWEKEELVRSHTLETGELRKKVSLLSDRLSTEATSAAMSVAPSTYTDFANEMDHLNMNEWDNFLSVDDMDSENVSPVQKPVETSLVVAPRTTDASVVMSDSDKPVASGLLLMLLLCGAFVASKSSGNSPPAIPRMPDDVRAASATVLDSIFKDAGVAPSPSANAHGHPGVMANRFEALEPAPSGSAWPEAHPVGPDFGGGGLSSLDALHHRLVVTSKDQEAEQLFSITPSQYNSLTSTDFPIRRVYTEEFSNDGLSPSSQPSHRRNLAETLAAMREESKGDTAAEVYTRSLLWDRIPSEVVREFKRMVEEGDLNSAAADRGNHHEDRKFAV